MKSVDYSDKSDSTKADVYNFQVNKYMNYYVNDVLVHNVKVLEQQPGSPHTN